MVGAMKRWWALCERVRSSKVAFFLLLAPNLIGIGYGYFFYYSVGQFNPASSFFRDYAWWPFIPDSPNAVVLCVLALGAYTFFGKRSRLLDGLAFTSMLYVGLWTTFLFLAYADEMGTWVWGSTNNLLFFSHMGMPLEAMLFVPALLKDKRAWGVPAAVVAWMALNIWLDYGPLNLHPAPFLHPADAVLHLWSPWIAVISAIGYLWASLLGKFSGAAKPRQ